MQVKRVKPTLWHRLYLGPIVGGLMVTLRHVFRRKDTLQYPEQRRRFGARYRGVPSLVKDQEGREKCVACYMCQWVCPPLAITIEADEYAQDHPQHHIEKYPKRFDINMLRCIYCGLCEEVCPEEAIFMSKTYVVTGLSREVMVFDKDKLYEIGGTREDDVRKWSAEHKGPAGRSHLGGDAIAPATAGGGH
jgi:NADH-quinone oxidoreductase subunit I